MRGSHTLTLSLPPPPAFSEYPPHDSKPTYIRYPSAPSLPRTALPSPILECTHFDFDDLETTEPFPEYIETMADFPDPANTLPPSPAAAIAARSAVQPQKPAVWERLAAPLLFVSFILGLYAVDERNRDRLDSASSCGSSEGEWEIGNWRALRMSAGSARSGVSAGTEEKEVGQTRGAEKGQAWFWRGKKRRLARMEVANALEMRGWIALCLVLVAMMGIMLALWSGGWAVGAVREVGWARAVERVRGLV
ncbi:MAG: hypothetical protein MMC23_002812 [Stictis urceolatum]|nr:hypothetical protein [Stictis urceolata]